ncbi:MAG: DUF131 domain-containing protein [Thermoplasmatota archaeon]
MMRLIKGSSVVFLVFAALFIALGVIRGEIEVGVAVFIPFLIGSGVFAATGFLCLFIGMILLFLSISAQWKINQDYPINDENAVLETKSSKQMSGVVFIGPFPIVFGSDKRFIIVLTIIAIIGSFLLYFILSHFI